ncbi:4Fe-4S binding protein [Phaeobacter sp. JH18-32]|uniref:4Fe-4S dicluster domain-containing protein n=1 Tax=Phaeobacter TaxID=302485 RepID=UPI003A87F24B
MTVWENVQLCLRSQPNVREMADLRTAVRVSHPGASYRRYNPESQVRWPLADLCEAAVRRRQQHSRLGASAPRSDQVLVMYDARAVEQLSWLKNHPPVAGMDVTAAATSGLERAGHADLLHAISDGFDWVLLESAIEENARLAQLREMELAACLGLEGRVVLFHSAAHLEQLLAEGIAQLPVIEHRRVDTESNAKPRRRREALQLFASVTLSQDTDVIALPQDAPYGGIELTGDCTLCQACTWMCPTNALIGAENGGGLDFIEADCMQCGLCVSVCRQNAIRLVPRLELKRDRLPVSLTQPDFFWSDGLSGGAETATGETAPQTASCGSGPTIDTPGAARATEAAASGKTENDDDHDDPDDWMGGGGADWSGHTVRERTDRGAGTGSSLLRLNDLGAHWPDWARLTGLMAKRREDPLS